MAQDASDAVLDHKRSLRRLAGWGLLAIGLFGATVGAWALATTISGAVIAPGQFVVDGKVKKVQHQTGGIVGELLVREGDRVEKGALLIRLDETQLRSNLQMVTKQLDEFAARAKRLRAERDGLERVPVAAELRARQSEAAVQELVASENSLFEARRVAREGQRLQLRKRIDQLQNEIDGVTAQQLARDRQALLIAKELESVLGLFSKNLVPLTRKNALEREVAALDGQKGQLIATVAQAEGKIAETRLQIQQIDDVVREEAIKELRDIEAKTAELTERRVAAEDQLQRVEIRAPAAGRVHQLAVHTVGGVIGAAEPAMLVVPTSDKLLFEARVQPPDIDQVAIGSAARVRILAFNQRVTPELLGHVSGISANTSQDPQTGAAYYTIRVDLPQAVLAKIAPHRITPGMQAEVFVLTEERTPLEYLVKPLSDQIAKAFRER